MKRLLGALAVVGLAACSSGKPEQAAAPRASSSQTPLAQLPAIDTNAVLEHTKVLSSDEFEGRAPGTKGEELTVNYLVDQFKKVGLKPGNTDGTYIQKVPLVGITPDPTTSLVFKKGAQQQRLTFKNDVVA